MATVSLRGAGKPAPGATTRMLAARVLAQVFTRGRSLKAELAWALPKLDDTRDRALLEAMCFAVLRRRSTYDAALAGWMQKPLSERDADLRTLLMVGFAQLEVLELPAHAALSATVDAARALGRDRQAGLVNAVLRRAQREGFPAQPPREAFPAWLADSIERDWPQQADAVFEASLQPAPLWLRANRQQGGRDAALAALQHAGINVVPSALCSDAIALETPVAVNQLPGFADGALSVQDLSAQQAADAFAPPQGARVLDACAAPGGKAAHLLERDPSLRLLALDIDARRLARVKDTFLRTGVGAQAQTLAADASDPGAWWDGVPFDAILLDAPCSATGVIRRQPDIMFHRRADDIDALVGAQARLLEACWGMLRPGGVLLYATCSILKAENVEQVRGFLKWHADARADALDDAFGLDCDGVGRQRLPGMDGGDGFFYARLLKSV
ncbi:16S rRNA (cytosine(967)-C(5))-methyltransferase RsmB [Stenotrophomonas sp. C3(2023)]|uniref:16S rRNA (cytosine(967)-C(5))-methyltransferase RsmB n=1 Tax=Stenotrophomonas sp. C3(2023) TaxID=3080277 RepID=UPI00293CC5B5|nr:16S rRNA (cytosine(967)-C(5))-methyltransferase RsmB [Stenotrophomonas sp. C3(2023)]MDV3469865.1 16S rRNA (cytosine(967)-C(5))-methyltransferase RsmB [Stenotrophomonas sp. C3(2023)]